MKCNYIFVYRVFLGTSGGLERQGDLPATQGITQRRVKVFHRHICENIVFFEFFILFQKSFPHIDRVASRAISHAKTARFGEVTCHKQEALPITACSPAPRLERRGRLCYTETGRCVACARVGCKRLLWHVSLGKGFSVALVVPRTPHEFAHEYHRTSCPASLAFPASPAC